MSCNMVRVNLEPVCKYCSCNVNFENLEDSLQPFTTEYDDKWRPMDIISY